MAVALSKVAAIITALLLLLLCRLSYVSMNLDDCDHTYDYREMQLQGFDRKCNDRLCKKYCLVFKYAPEASECDVDDEYVCCCRYCNLKRPKPDGDCEPNACKGECTALDYALETSDCRGSYLCCCLYDNIRGLLPDESNLIPDLVPDNDSIDGSDEDP